MLLMPEMANSKGFFKKFISQDLVQDAWLKYGYYGSIASAQFITGLVESHKYSGDRITSDSDYHVWRYAQNMSLLSAGYFSTANLRSKNLKFKTKAKRMISGVLIGRMAFEFAYRANRTGKFLYYGEETFNDKALMLISFDFSKGKFIDFAISGHGSQGVAIDLICTALAFYFYE